MMPVIFAIQGMNLTLGVVLGIVGSALIGWSLSSLIRYDRVQYRATYRRVCRSLGINGKERRVLNLVARQAELPSPVSMLMSRGCFDFALSSGSLTSQDASMLDSLRTRLFST